MATKKTLPYFPFYPADFTAKTIRLTDAEVGAYIRLLCEQWITGDIPSVITSDGTHVPKVLRMICESAEESWPAISKYFEVDGTGMKNPRMEQERIKSTKIYNKRVNAGKASAKARGTSVATSVQTSVGTTQNSDFLSKDKKELSQSFLDVINDSGIIFSSTTVPNLLQTLYNREGIEAVNTMLDILRSKTPSQQNSGAYVRKIIDNTDFTKPKEPKQLKTADIYRELPDD